MNSEQKRAATGALRFLDEEDGVTAIEYGLLAALIAIGIIVGLQATGASVFSMYEKWTSAVLAAL
jgi:pilus assembly protein Flp/PilA